MKDVYVVDYLVYDCLGKDVATNYANMPQTPGAETVYRYNPTEFPQVKCTKAFQASYLDNGYTTYRLAMDIVDDFAEKYGAVLPTDSAVLFGSFAIGSEGAKQEFNEAFDKQLSRFSPTKLFSVNYDLLSSSVAGKLKLEGINSGLNGSCSTSMFNLQFASMLIQTGQAPAVVVGAAEMPVLARMQYYWQCTSAISHQDGGYCKPFDNSRDGFIQGEGASVWFLCDEETLLKYNLTPKAKIRSIASGARITSMTAHDKTGENQIKIINNALHMAGMQPKDVGFFNAHATSTLVGDDIEFDVFQQVFHNCDVPIVSFKGYVGHTMSACGLIESAYGLEAARTKKLHPNHNLTDPLSLDARLIVQPTVLENNIFIKTSFGFGGRTSVGIFESL